MNEPVYVTPWSGWYNNQNDALPVLLRAPLETSAPGYTTLTFPIITAAHELVCASRIYAFDPISGNFTSVNVDAATSALKVSDVAATGASINGTAVASGIIKPANANSKQVIVQNIDAAETLYVSFNNPATVNDITLQPGMSITYNAGVANAIYGLGTGAGAKYSIQELS